MATPIILTVDHADVSGTMEWSLECEEVLGGTGSAQLIYQDRSNNLEPPVHADVKATIRNGGVVRFRGEIVSEPMELPVGQPWRKWKVLCSDYGIELPQRLVGAFDGVTWQDVDGLGDWVNIDPHARSLATDKLTIQDLFDHYIRVDGTAIGTSTFVGEFLTNFGPIFWSYSDLQKALEEMAGFIAGNLQFWVDPDLEFHWQLIPAWQDAAQQGAAIAGAPTSAGLTAALFPQAAVANLAFASVEISDVKGSGKIGCRNLKFDYDGSAMPQQLYVQGATGYVYNAPAVSPAGQSVTVAPGGYGTKSTEVLHLTFLATTRVWHKQANGLIATTYTTIGAGGPYNVKFIAVPYNPANGKGGHFWELLNGPAVGGFIDNDTDYFGYGSIKVEKIIVVTTPPKIGIGGSGFVGEAIQDPTKRQAYLQAPISTDVNLRDSLGGQVLYRALFPTLRGSLEVSAGHDEDGNLLGPDDWRVGQLVKITDARLPAALNGKYFVIQRVATKLVAGQDIRFYTIDWGDGPSSRFSWQPKPSNQSITFPPPVTQVVIQAFDLSPGPNATQIVTGQLTAKDGTPWQVARKVVKWTVEAYTSPGGTLVPLAGTVTPEASATDAHGKARTTLRTGAADGLVYFVFGNVAV